MRLRLIGFSPRTSPVEYAGESNVLHTSSDGTIKAEAI